MKIQYCSDLHLEFHDNRAFVAEYPLYPEGDILLLGGDIVTFDKLHYAQDFFNYVSDHFEAIYWVPGNHEYYYGDISQRSGSFEEKITGNVTLLNNTVLNYKGTELIFSTLWSAISPAHAWQVERRMNDFEAIRDNEARFTTIKYHELHRAAVEFLTEALYEPVQGPRVVVTHHRPTFEHYPA
jgi:predicted phosphohydrolase